MDPPTKVNPGHATGQLVTYLKHNYITVMYIILLMTSLPITPKRLSNFQWRIIMWRKSHKRPLLTFFQSTISSTYLLVRFNFIKSFSFLLPTLNLIWNFCLHILFNFATVVLILSPSLPLSFGFFCVKLPKRGQSWYVLSRVRRSYIMADLHLLAMKL